MAQDGNARRFLPCYGAQRLASPRTQLNTFPLSIRILAEEKKKGNISISGDNQEVLLGGASACVKENPLFFIKICKIFHTFIAPQLNAIIQVGNVIPKLKSVKVIFLILPTRPFFRLQSDFCIMILEPKLSVQN